MFRSHFAFQTALSDITEINAMPHLPRLATVVSMHCLEEGAKGISDSTEPYQILYEKVLLNAQRRISDKLLVVA